jgi:hypothetical protein
VTVGTSARVGVGDGRGVEVAGIGDKVWVGLSVVGDTSSGAGGLTPQAEDISIKKTNKKILIRTCDTRIRSSQF